MIEVGLFDGTFKGESMGYGEENADKAPHNIKWVRDESKQTTVFTDMHIETAKSLPGRKIAWLIEPYDFSSTAYEKTLFHLDLFDFVISHDLHFLNGINNSKTFYCPLGGSWIDNQLKQPLEKSKLVSFITTSKNRTPGHRMRHWIFENFLHWRDIDCFGAGAQELPKKSLALRNYCYSIVVESSRTSGYFSEKLIDCITEFTIPIYWGTPDIGHYFNPKGIIPFENLSELRFILDLILKGEDGFDTRFEAMAENAELANQYRCPEDWAFTHYPWLFR